MEKKRPNPTFHPQHSTLRHITQIQPSIPKTAHSGTSPKASPPSPILHTRAHPTENPPTRKMSLETLIKGACMESMQCTSQAIRIYPDSPRISACGRHHRCCARLLTLSVYPPMPGYKITRLRNNWDCGRLSFISLHLVSLIMGMNVQFSPAISGHPGQVALHFHSVSVLRLSEKNEMWQFKLRGPGGGNNERIQELQRSPMRVQGPAPRWRN